MGPALIVRSMSLDQIQGLKKARLRRVLRMKRRSPASPFRIYPVP